MHFKKFALALSAGLLAVASAFAAPAKDPVAEGFLDWENVTDKHLLWGLSLTPSDLRQRTVVYVVVDDAWLTNAKAAELASAAGLIDVPYESFSWDTMDFVLKQIVVVSVRNGKASDKATFAERLKAPKGAEDSVRTRYQTLARTKMPFYRDLAPAGEAELAADRLPYVAVYSPDSAEPVFKAAKFDFASMKDVRKAMNDAAKKFPTDWTWPLGVREPQHCKTLPALVAKGKTEKELQAALKPSLKSDDPEVAKEARIISDAISQYGTMLRLRIALEYARAPARACYDASQLVKMFPSEKKKIAAIDAKLKKLPEASSLGKLMEKLMLWSRDDFAPKSVGEAKKIVAEIQKMKKTLEVLSNSQNAAVQGEAMLISSRLDTLIDTIQAKVPAK